MYMRNQIQSFHGKCSIQEKKSLFTGKLDLKISKKLVKGYISSINFV
jgi:hypothetical protein